MITSYKIFESKTSYLYHGTSVGAGIRIQRDGIKPMKDYGEGEMTSSFTEDLDWAHYYMKMKGGSHRGIMLRVPFKDDVFRLTDRIRDNKGDEWVTNKIISPEEIEIKVGDRWIPIIKYDFIDGVVLEKVELKGDDFIYVTPDISYANAYASGMNKSSAHMGVRDLKNGVIFVVWLSDEWEPHWGGDVWKSGFESDVINDLKEYKKSNRVSRLLEDMFERAGIDWEDGEISSKRLNGMIKNPVENLLQLISPWEWCNIQDYYQGYSEIALKGVEWNRIIEIRVYKGGELDKRIRGGYRGKVDWEEDVQNIFYHGSPLGLWEGKL